MSCLFGLYCLSFLPYTFTASVLCTANIYVDTAITGQAIALIHALHMYIQVHVHVCSYLLLQLKIEWNWVRSSWEQFQDVCGGVDHGSESLPYFCMYSLDTRTKGNICS